MGYIFQIRVNENKYNNLLSLTLTRLSTGKTLVIEHSNNIIDYALQHKDDKDLIEEKNINNTVTMMNYKNDNKVLMGKRELGKLRVCLVKDDLEANNEIEKWVASNFECVPMLLGTLVPVINHIVHTVKRLVPFRCFVVEMKERESISLSDEEIMEWNKTLLPFFYNHFGDSDAYTNYLNANSIQNSININKEN